MAGQRKLAGILCEAVAGPGGGLLGVVCGMGTNRVRPAVVEGVLAERGVWLDELGVRIEPVELAAALLGGVLARTEQVSTDPGALVRDYAGRCDTIGRDVRVELAGGVLEGRAEGIRADGALVVDGVAVTAGDVVHLRPAG